MSEEVLATPQPTTRHAYRVAIEALPSFLFIQANPAGVDFCGSEEPAPGGVALLQSIAAEGDREYCHSSTDVRGLNELSHYLVKVFAGKGLGKDDAFAVYYLIKQQLPPHPPTK